MSLPTEQCDMAHDVGVRTSGGYGAMCEGGLCWYWMVRILVIVGVPMLICEQANCSERGHSRPLRLWRPSFCKQLVLDVMPAHGCDWERLPVHGMVQPSRIQGMAGSLDLPLLGG
jgi:hypothetical protein